MSLINELGLTILNLHPNLHTKNELSKLRLLTVRGLQIDRHTERQTDRQTD